MSNLNLTPVSSGQTNKYVTINDADAALESAMTELLSVDLSAGNHTISTAEFTRNFGFKTTGNTIARNLTLQATKRVFWIKNGGSFLLNVILGSTTLTLKSGSYSWFATDGTANGVEKIDPTIGGSIAFTSLSDVPANYTSAGRKIVRVNAAATALEFVDMAYTPAFYQEAVMTNAQVVYKLIAVVPFTIPAGGTGSQAHAETGSAGNVHFDIFKNGADVGDIVFNISQNGTFTIGSDISMAAGDILIIKGPATADGSLAGVAVSLKGYLT